VVNAKPRPLYPGKQTRYPLYRRLGGPQDRSGWMRKILPPTGIRSPDRPARSESSYRLRYSGPLLLILSFLYFHFFFTFSSSSPLLHVILPLFTSSFSSSFFSFVSSSSAYCYCLQSVQRRMLWAALNLCLH